MCDDNTLSDRNVYGTGAVMRIALAAFLSLLPSLAWGQAAVQQVGPATKYDATGWIQDHQIESSSKMYSDTKRGFNPFHVFDDGKAEGVCVDNKLSNVPNSTLCLGHDAVGNGVISVEGTNVNALPTGLNFNINGSVIPFDQLLSGSVTITGSVKVANNAALLAVSTAQLPTVYREGFTSPGDGGDSWYIHSASPCSLASGNGDGGSQVKASDNGCWLAPAPPGGWRPEMFGATRNGTTDVAVPVQAAANAATGGRLVFGQYWYCIGTPINIPVSTTVVGSGRGDRDETHSGIRACVPNMTAIFNLGTGSYLGHMNIRGDYAGANSSGRAINTTLARNVMIEQVFVQGSCVSASLNGNTLTIRNSILEGQSGLGANCGGIEVGNTTTGETADVRISGVTVSANITNRPLFGAWLYDCGGCAVDGYSDFIGARQGFVIGPGPNQHVQNGFFNNSALGDTNSEYATFINAGYNTAQIADLTFTGSWSASSSGSAGVYIGNSGGGVVSNISFLGHRAYNNTGSGYILDVGIDNIRISDNQFCNNGQGASGSVDIKLLTGVSKVQLVGNNHQGVCGWPPSLYRPDSAVQLVGNNSNVLIVGNNMTGVGYAPIIGNPTGNSLIQSNLGLDGAFTGAASSAGVLNLNAVYPRWSITNAAAITTIQGSWDSRTVLLWPTAGPVSFNTGGNICNALVSPTGSYVTATYISGTSNCWLLK